jgi:hypothetical protein
MAKKKDGKPSAPAALVISVRPGESAAHAVAASALDPTAAAACTITRINAKLPELDVNAFAAELQAKARAANSGNSEPSEAMLVAESHTLDCLFHTLTGWALNHVGQGGNAAYFETFMRLALKAQSQARATVETLAEIKNPPVVFARQANIANGPQQVNNGAETRVREIKSPQTKLLEAEHGERLDSRTTAATSGANQELAAVGTIDGTEDGRR